MAVSKLVGIARLGSAGSCSDASSHRPSVRRSASCWDHDRRVMERKRRRREIREQRRVSWNIISHATAIPPEAVAVSRDCRDAACVSARMWGRPGALSKLPIHSSAGGYLCTEMTFRYGLR